MGKSRGIVSWVEYDINRILDEFVLFLNQMQSLLICGVIKAKKPHRAAFCKVIFFYKGITSEAFYSLMDALPSFKKGRAIKPSGALSV